MNFIIHSLFRGYEKKSIHNNFFYTNRQRFYDCIIELYILSFIIEMRGSEYSFYKGWEGFR